MSRIAHIVEAWVAQAKPKLACGKLAAADLEILEAEIKALTAPTTPAAETKACTHKPRRQRLLYLHATTPNIASRLVGATLHEPKTGGISQMDPLQKDPTYNSVHEAIIDGWQVIHFPDQQAPFDDKEIDILGYEFILQKIEAID